MLRAHMSVLFLVLLAIPALSHAAFFPSSVYVAIQATPEYPAANSDVTLKANTARTMGVYSYAWFVDDELYAEGVDITSISIRTKGPGQQTIVTLEITDSEGIIRGTTDYTIQPGSVDLVWEGRTYTPPFYRGRPYPNANSTIALEAIPHLFSPNGRINKNDLVYTWEIDGKVVQAISGYGKSTARVSPSRFRNETLVRLTVESRDRVYATQTSVRIPAVDPVFVLYEKIPLAGTIFEKAIQGTYTLDSDEASFELIPYFVNNANDLNYTWSLNQNPFEVEPLSPRVATLRREGGGGGVYTVQVEGKREEALYDRGKAGFTLTLD